MGGGVWEQFGQGKMLVGYDPNDNDFDTLEKTGGEKEVILTSSQSAMPSHIHNFSDSGKTGSGGSHSHTFTGSSSSVSISPQAVTDTNITVCSVNAGGDTDFVIDSVSKSTLSGSVIPKGTISSNESHSHSFSVSGTTESSSKSTATESHNNLPPYIVVYMWRRTA